MGQPFSVSAQIEILASPATVRSVFLDFPRYKEWHQGWTFEPIDSGKKPFELKTGDGLRVNLGGMVFHPPVVENSTDCFAWKGSLYGLIVGTHYFSFSPSKKNIGGTTFIQREDFRGPLMVFFPGASKKNWSMDGWNAFNAALKKEVEKSSL